MPWMLSANFLAGIHFLPVPARLELGPCGRKIQHKHFGDGEWAEALGIMSRKPARVVEEARDKSLHNNETLYLNVRARVGNRKPSSFSANPALTRESHSGHSPRRQGRSEDSQIFRATAMIFQGKEAKVMGFSPDQFATLTRKSVLQL